MVLIVQQIPLCLLLLVMAMTAPMSMCARKMTNMILLWSEVVQQTLARYLAFRLLPLSLVLALLQDRCRLRRLLFGKIITPLPAGRMDNVPPTQVSSDPQVKKRNFLNMFFSNITWWGLQAKSEIFSDEFKSKFQVVGVVETHTNVESNTDMKAQASAQGFSVDANVAMQYSNTMGNHGGEAVFAFKFTYSIPIEPEIIE